MLEPKAAVRSNEIDVASHAREIRSEPHDGRGIFARLFWVAVGVGVMLTGFAMMLSVFVAFIGLPLFVFGLALVQSQER